MRRFASVIVCVGALALGSCAPGSQLDKIGTALTTSIANPVSDTNIYQVQNSYALALQLLAEYRRYCWSKPYSAILADSVAKPVCEKRRAVVRFAIKARKDARAALDAAELFIANNPTLNAATAVQAAWLAVNNFQSAFPRSQ
jgi:hypothetical protein